MAYPVPTDWTVCGTLNKNGVPFSAGKVYADNLKNGEFQQIAETGISANGSFILTFSRANFQNGDNSLEFPTIRIRVEDYQRNTLWTSNIYNEPSAALNIGPIDISKHPDQNGDCRIFGTVKNEQGNILESITIVAYCLHFVDTSETNNNPSGYFEKIILGETTSDSNGNYERRYSSTLLPAGLLLDSKEDYGKNKASLYAEAYEEKEGKLVHKATEHLVFNGKTEQEINFVLKSRQEFFECEYEKLPSVLEVYRNAVIAWSDDPNSITKKINAIHLFLKSNTTFPLVVGRERIVDNKVHAYFTAYSILLQLQKRNLDGYNNFTAEDESCWLEIFFALALREGVSTLYKLTRTKPTVIQKTLFGAVSDGLICPTDTTLVLNLWKVLVNGGTLQGEEDENDKNEALTISQLLSLYIKNDLSIEYPTKADDSFSHDDSENEEKTKEFPHYVAVENFDEEEGSLYDKLLDAYYSVGADVDAFVELLQENVPAEKGEQTEGDAGSESDAGENETKPDDEELDIQIESDVNILPSQEIVVPHLTQKEISRLKAVFDMNDFFEKFVPGVVCTYRYVTKKENFDFNKLSDLLRLADDDWKDLVDDIAKEYYSLYCYGNEKDKTDEATPPCALPAEFPGNNAELKKVIYARKFSELIIAWFPQQALLWDLTKRFGDANWGKVCEELLASKWENFSLSNTDLDEYVGKDESFFDISGVKLENSTESQENDGISPSELTEAERDKIRKQNKEKILQIQRLYHLTENAKAIAYLIESGFKSAYQISTMSESEFMARHGSGIGKAAEARRIHRLAQNYMAEASLNIQAYVTSTGEEPVDEDLSLEVEDDESLILQNDQNEQETRNETLQALPRALPKTRMLAASKSAANTNTAKIRESTHDTINWAGLFGNVNFTKATQGQSILSASAYYIDLLKFLKKSSAYLAFLDRRPDYLDLQLTKANAEIPMPTIDLGIELLESLVAGSLKSEKAKPIANNNPDDATAEKLRSEPLEFKNKNGYSIDEAAAVLLANSIYPFQLPVNFSRNKVKKILSNLSLHFYDIAEALELNGNNTNVCRELRLDFNQRSLVDLLSADTEKQEALAQFNSIYNTWDLWGLKERANSVLYPDKNYTSAGTYIGILRRVTIFMQKTGFTIQDLNEILGNKKFKDVCYRPKDSKLYQLSNINGYEFAGKKTTVDGKEVEIAVDWDSFFRKMAVLVHRKNILGWSLSNILLTFDLPLEKLDVICELVGRYGISVQDALVLGGEQEATTEFINSVYQLPNLLVNVTKDLDGYRRAVLKLLTLGLKLPEADAISIYNMIDVDADASLLKGLFECYRYNLIAKTFGISLSSLDKVLKYGVWTDNHSLASIRKLADNWRILSGTSIDAEFYLDLLAPISEEEKNAANDFALNLVAFGLDEKPTPENLRLLICAEFGIVKDYGEELLSADLTKWEAFYDEAIDKKTHLSQTSYKLYTNFLRSVSVYNFTQNSKQGIDLTEIDFLLDTETETSGYEKIRPLVVANYVTDRLLSGDFDINKLIEDDNLEDLLTVDSEIIGDLKKSSFKNPADCTSLDGWLKFTRYYELYSKTHLQPTNLNDLLSEIDLVPTSDDYEENFKNSLSTYAASVKKLEDTVKSHTKESEWLKFAQEMNDELRKRKRDALAAYVCWDSCFVPEGQIKSDSRYPKQFVDESDIYAYYLMDVKMEPDMTISRIVQASASIQLFVQRAELGLEGPNVLTDEQRSEWEWMKNYRVWEAARKVFLYPENWIASDLRDDKTPFFEELEDRIQEFSDDHASLENALYEYLEKVREVSSVEIVGATKEDGGDEGGILYTLHIVGRTQGEPHTYYYRKYKAKAILPGEWTPWERLDVDIPSETVVPAIVNQRLYLLWPQVTMGQRNLEAASEGGLETIEYYARIQICWTSYTGTKWTGTRMTSNALIDASTNPLDFALGDNEKIDDRYHLKTESSLDSVAVSVVKTAYHYQEYEEIVGKTEVMDGSTKINKVTKRVYDKSRQYFKRIAIIKVKADGSDLLELFTAEYQPIDDYAPERTKLVHGVFVEDENFTCGNKGFSYPEDNAVLNYTPGLFRIVATNLSMLKLDKDDKAEDLPFFYMDGRRTFFVQAVPKDGKTNSNQKNYKFELLSHSLVDDFYKRYRDGGTKWLYTRETQALPISDSYYYSYSYYNYYFSVYLGYYMAGDWQAWDLGQTIFRYNYWPNKANVDGPYPAPMVDFVWGGANAMYNWELFFYVPMLIAEKMIAEQNYEEALLWLQLVFDPKEKYSSYERTKDFIRDLPKGARYWKFLPFFANKDADKSVLEMLGLPTKQDKLPNRSALSSLVDKWKNDPFNPHLIARYRNVAYQKYVVMKYLDALIGWGDQEFSKDTTESVNLAIQFYLLAAELLGPKSPEAPEPEPTSPLTVRQLLSKTDDLGNAFIQYENSALIGKDNAKVLEIRAMDERAKRTGNIIESMFYFSVPRNDTLFSYWDTVADRLYKIRNSLNIQGVKRTLALFAPPIDPGMLAKARALGISVDSILNSTNEKLPIYRFRVIVKLAVDMAKDACQMGRDLLAILEKKDAEQLRAFKAKCDKAVVAESKAVHEMEIKSLEAEKVRLEEKKTAKQNAAKKKKTMHIISATEKKYRKLMEKVAKIQETVEKVRSMASATFKIPDFKYGAVTNAFGGPRFDIESLGGTKLAENLVSAAESYAARFAQRQLDAAKVKLQAEQERLKKEWTVEDELADAEIVEVEKQEVINEIKTQQVEKKQKSIENEILRSEQVYEILSEKFTNSELYGWLEKELGKVFRSYVALLLDVAKMAERVYHFEIEGKTNTDYNFINQDYWDNFRKGLLAPERILLDLRQMEKAYLENDVHKIEITRPISLKNLKTSDNEECALDILRSSGICTFKIGMDLFNADFEDFFFHRIKDIRLQIKLSDEKCCFMNAELSLTKCLIDIKKNAAKEEDFVPAGEQGTFATSLANKEPRLFDFSFTSNSRKIFEDAGAISEWNLKITGLDKVNETYPIEDVIVYLSYTAKN